MQRLFFAFLLAAPFIYLSTIQVSAASPSFSEGEAIQQEGGMFLPQVLPGEQDLATPQRGAQYYGSETPPPNLPRTDRYRRWCWRLLEPQPGHYNFALIDEQLAAAKQAGVTFGFRILPLTPSESGPCLPSDLAQGPLDWNAPHYLERARALFTALGERYRDDPRLGWLDMSLYGCWGEWHLVCDHADMTPMTIQNQQALIDLQVQAFPHTQFLMFTDEQEALTYALSLAQVPPIGIRIDCLGSPQLGGARPVLEQDEQARERWRRAPLVFEYCEHPQFSQALKDSTTFHASIIGDGEGNLASFEDYTPMEQEQLRASFRRAGYRYVLTRVQVTARPEAGTALNIQANWENRGIAPIYSAWQVFWQLSDAAGHLAWQARSQVDLRTILPAEQAQGTATASHQEMVQLPATLAPGRYTLSVQVRDAQRYYNPLPLAIEGRQGDGSYRLGTIDLAPAQKEGAKSVPEETLLKEKYERPSRAWKHTGA